MYTLCVSCLVIWYWPSAFCMLSELKSEVPLWIPMLPGLERSESTELCASMTAPVTREIETVETIIAQLCGFFFGGWKMLNEQKIEHEPPKLQGQLTGIQCVGLSAKVIGTPKECMKPTCRFSSSGRVRCCGSDSNGVGVTWCHSPALCDFSFINTSNVNYQWS